MSDLELRKALAKAAGWKWYGDYACNHNAGHGEESLYLEMQLGPLTWKDVVAVCKAAGAYEILLWNDPDANVQFVRVSVLPKNDRSGSHMIRGRCDVETLAECLIAACRERETQQEEPPQ